MVWCPKMSAEAYQRLLSKKRRRMLERAEQLRRTFTVLPMKKIIQEVNNCQ